MRQGKITLVDGNSEQRLGDAHSDLEVIVRVHDQSFYSSVAFGGSIGAGESYVRGEWDCDDLVGLIRVFSRNMEAASEMGGIANFFADAARRTLHRLNRNTRSGSRRNIAAHYDLSNDFYSLFLDPTMTYSSGVFPSESSSMEEASVEKYDRICRKLQLKPTDRVVEIGTGWGGFAIHAAKNFGCHITTTTISQEQFGFAKQRIESLGLADRIDLKLEDYRDLTGQFDKLVSIEMIEAVGHEFYDTFFSKCSSLLKNDGCAAIQAITIPDQRFEQYKRSVDFIQKYIFPGGCLPSLGAMVSSMKRKTDFQVAHLEDFAEHYGRTLACWRQRFHENRRQILELGMSESFMRLWDYYLCYCEGAFREKQIGVSQLLLQKAGSRQAASFPSLGDAR